MSSWQSWLPLMVLIGLAGPSGHPHVPHLEVVTAGGDVVWSGPIATGEAFDVSFRHSHERCRWIQHYRFNSTGAIEQTASTFPCFGAGMPFAPSGAEPPMVTPQGYRMAAQLSLEEIPMINWRPAEIDLTHRGRTIFIGDQIADFEPFVVRIR